MKRENLEEKVGLLDRIRATVKNNLGILAVSAALALGLAGCGRAYVMKNGGVYREEIRFLSPNDSYLVCPLPQPPRVLPGIDPGSCKLNAQEYARYDSESSQYARCVKETTGESVPERPLSTKDSPEEICKDQTAWQKMREDLVKMQEYASNLEKINQGLLDALNKRPDYNVKIEPKTTVSPITTITPETTFSNEVNDSSLTESTRSFNQQKQAVYSKGITLSLEEQEAICSGRNSSVTLLGTVKFNDCIFDPRDNSSTGLDLILEKSASSPTNGGILLYCGSASEPLASRCFPQIIDYGNLQLTWDRGRSLADKQAQQLGEKLNNFTQIVYANGTILNERSVAVYLVENKN